MLQELLLLNQEERKAKVASLSDSDKQLLLSEINQNTKEAEAEMIRLETNKANLEEQEKNLLKELESFGIKSYEELEKEINKLEEEINSKIIEYTDKLKGE